MSEETAEVFRAMDDLRKAKRAALGVNCPRCATARPKAHPSILLPQQRCRVDGYRDPRPHPADAELDAALAPYGFRITNGAQS